MEGQVAIGGHTQRNVRVVAQIQRMTRTFPRVHEETALCVTNGDSAERQFRRGFRLRTKRHLEGRVTAEQKYRQFPPNRHFGVTHSDDEGGESRGEGGDVEGNVMVFSLLNDSLHPIEHHFYRGIATNYLQHVREFHSQRFVADAKFPA